MIVTLGNLYGRLLEFKWFLTLVDSKVAVLYPARLCRLDTCWP